MLQSQLIGTVAYGATGYFQESGPDEFLQDLECMGVRVWKWDGRWVASYKITAPSHPCRSWSGGIVRSGKLYITAQHIKESLFKGLDELDGGGAEQDDEQAWENK